MVVLSGKGLTKKFEKISANRIKNVKKKYSNISKLPPKEKIEAEKTLNALIKNFREEDKLMLEITRSMDRQRTKLNKKGKNEETLRKKLDSIIWKSAIKGSQ